MTTAEKAYWGVIAACWLIAAFMLGRVVEMRDWLNWLGTVSCVTLQPQPSSINPLPLPEA